MKYKGVSKSFWTQS